MADPLTVLTEIDFLSQLPLDVLQQVASIAKVQDFPEGALIFRQGTTADTVYFVVHGRVALEICAAGVGCKRILTLGPGELLGWSPVLQPGSLTATARTLQSTQCIALNGEQLLALCEQNTRFGYEFMRRAALALAQRLNSTRLQLIDVYGTQMPSVVAGDSPTDR